MNTRGIQLGRGGIKRRAFLTGAGSVAIGLPFLESLQDRSAWAAESNPVFTLFVVGQNGVVNKNFFPSATGTLSRSAADSAYRTRGAPRAHGRAAGKPARAGDATR